MKEKANQKIQTVTNPSVESSLNHGDISSRKCLDEIDRAILQILQDDFPLVKRPWLEISRRLNISQSELTSRSKRLIETGMFLKIGPILDSSALGLPAATLVAMRVPKSRVSEVAAIINGFRNVSHNYERDGEYNVWFTLAAPSTGELAAALAEIKGKTGVEEDDMLDLPSLQRFKVDVRFQLSKMTF